MDNGIAKVYISMIEIKIKILSALKSVVQLWKRFIDCTNLFQSFRQKKNLLLAKQVFEI